MEWGRWRIFSAEEKFEAFVKKHQVNLMQYIRRRIFSREDAEDIYQEVLLAASRKWSQLRDYENPLGWLFGAANICIAQWRRENLGEIEHRSDIPLWALEDKIPTLKEDWSLEELFTSGMTADERRILLEYYRDRHTLSELAAKYGLSANAAKKRLERSREHIRAELEKE